MYIYIYTYIHICIYIYMYTTHYITSHSQRNTYYKHFGRRARSLPRRRRGGAGRPRGSRTQTNNETRVA